MKDIKLKRILALSSSRAGDSGYLELALPHIQLLLGDQPLQIAFIPYAAVDNDYEAYAQVVKDSLQSLPHSLKTAVPADAKSILQNADVIMVGGGNTFKLLHDLYVLGLLDIIRDKVSSGTPYIGWSAGANILAPTIGTTNDMPVIEPKSFNALGLLPFQVNPHYNNTLPAGHRGETRDQRLAEFVQLNPGLPVLGLPEGTALQLSDGHLALVGPLGAVLFTGSEAGMVKRELAAGETLTGLL
jgi:dipeptidase E